MVGDLPSQRATQIVNERQGTYGHPGDVYAKAATFWSVVFGHEVTVHQVAECLSLVKHAREINSGYPPDYRDNRDDYAGYANVAQMIHDWEEGDRNAADS
jgi:Domain of unknown function (DUF6378)